MPCCTFTYNFSNYLGISECWLLVYIWGSYVRVHSFLCRGWNVRESKDQMYLTVVQRCSWEELSVARHTYMLGPQPLKPFRLSRGTWFAVLSLVVSYFVMTCFRLKRNKVRHSCKLRIDVLCRHHFEIIIKGFIILFILFYCLLFC